jgi:D-apionolactonase
MPSDRLSPSRRSVAFGPWRAELVGDELADLRRDGRPVVQAVRAVVRDEDWRTLTPHVLSVDDNEAAGRRVLRLRLNYTGWGLSYSGEVTIRLSADEITVDFHGVTDAGFRGNRVGLVVLHHPANAGMAVAVTSPDGSIVHTRFPVEISPHQPFMNVAGLRWQQGGLDVALRFTGDVFETEDQRNWTDASFKTYSTPLAQPYPVDHAAGSEVRQSIVITAQGAETATFPVAAANDETSPVIAIGTKAVARVPALGVAASTDPGARDRPHGTPIDGLYSLLVELAGSRDDRLRTVQTAAAEARELGVPLDVRVIAADAAELSATLDAVPLHQAIRLGVYDPVTHVSEPGLWRALVAEAHRRQFGGTLLAGSRAHFTELNRTSERLPRDAGAVTFSMTPQMHARDIEHVVQTLRLQGVVARNALRLAGGRPLHIGPITLRPRFNAVAVRGGYDEKTAAGLSTDELQPEPFTAAWTLGSIAALSAVSPTSDTVASISYFELTGSRGIRSGNGELYPVGRLLRAIAALRGADVLEVLPAPADTTVIYPVRTQEAIVLFVANLAPRSRELTLSIAEALDAARAGVEVFADTGDDTDTDKATVTAAPGELRSIRSSAQETTVTLGLGPWTAIAVTCPRTPHTTGQKKGQP